MVVAAVGDWGDVVELGRVGSAGARGCDWSAADSAGCVVPVVDGGQMVSGEVAISTMGCTVGNGSDLITAGAEAGASHHQGDSLQGVRLRCGRDCALRGSTTVTATAF